MILKWLKRGGLLAGVFSVYIVSLFFIGYFLSHIAVLDIFLSMMPSERLKGVNILAIGVDDTEYVKRSDAIIIFHLDPGENRIGVLSVPRDTRVQAEGLGYTKINHTYAHGGVSLLQKTVSDFVGVPIDHFMKVNLQGISNIVDTLGGIEVDVEKELNYTDQAAGLYIQLDKGKQRLNGDQAMQYLRFRQDSEGDIGRIRRQQYFIQQVAKQMTRPSKILTIPSLISKIGNVIETDMSFPEMMGLVLQFKSAYLQGEIQKGTVPGGIVLINGASYWKADIGKMDEKVSEILLGFGRNDVIEAETLVETVSEESSKDDRRRVTVKEVRRVAAQSDINPDVLLGKLLNVEILNGYGKKGVAHVAASLLKARGLKISRINNAGTFNYKKTLIVDWKGDIENVIVLANLLQIDPDRIIVYDRPSKPLDATIVMGEDWDEIVTRLVGDSIE
jgi:polyisoprenyl-teichoic acid--peptidoglycan teichoic acid transferase